MKSRMVAMIAVWAAIFLPARSIFAFDARITVTEKAISGKISPLMFGSGLMWWEGYTAPPADGSESRAWRLFKEMGITTLRFPGGADCHPYRWDSLKETRRVYEAEKLWKPWHEGTSPAGHYSVRQFLDLCRKYGIEPVLQVPTMYSWDAKAGQGRWLNGTTDLRKMGPAVRYAADWVRDVKKSGYRVTYWEIGNEEMCYPGMTGKLFGQYVHLFAKAMRAADPEIKLIAAASRRGWNDEFLKVAGKDIDYFSYHYWPLKNEAYKYPPGMGINDSDFFTETDLKTKPADELYLAHLATLVEGRKRLEYDVLTPLAKTGGRVKFAWTEWNWPAYLNPFNYSQGQALLNTEQFLTVLEKDCQIAHYWAATGWNFEMINVSKGYPYYPTGDAFRLLRKYARGRMMKVTVDGPTIPVKGTRVPVVTAHLSRTDRSWALFILNHHPSEKAEVAVPDLVAAGTPVKRVQMVSDNLTMGPREDYEYPERYHKIINSDVKPAGRGLHVEMPPHSLTVLTQEF